MQKVARQLGRYHVLDRIAFGGMAEIFRAITFDDEGRAKLVAIKQVLPHYAEDREFIDMLVDEAKLISMLHHYNIVEIFELGVFDGIYYVAMEYVWGKDLRAVLERCRARGMRLPYEVSAHLLSEALAGLDTAHRLLDPAGNPAGLVHRDFSPSNILISYSGHIKICDFGIAKATFSRTETKTGVIKGKVKYMSPEQAFGRKLDHRSDLFSAGSVFYEMLTNEPPFLANNEIDLIFLVRDAQITPPSKRAHDVPRSMEELVYRSMARARSARFQSAAEFRLGLSTYLRQRGMGNWKAELGRFMQTLYQKEIAHERAVLNEYILDPSSIEQDLGENLIADALGRDAAYTKFNPFPTRAYPLPADSAVHDASTRIIEAPAAKDVASMFSADQSGQLVALEEQATMILHLPDNDEEEEEEEGLAQEKTGFWAKQNEGPSGSPRPQGAPPKAPPPAPPPPRSRPTTSSASHQVAQSPPPYPGQPLHTAPPKAPPPQPMAPLPGPGDIGASLPPKAPPPKAPPPLAPSPLASPAPPPLPSVELAAPPPKALPPRPKAPVPPPLPPLTHQVGPGHAVPPKAPPPPPPVAPPKAPPPHPTRTTSSVEPVRPRRFGGDLDESELSTIPFQELESIEELPATPNGQRRSTDQELTVVAGGSSSRPQKPTIDGPEPPTAPRAPRPTSSARESAAEESLDEAPTQIAEALAKDPQVHSDDTQPTRIAQFEQQPQPHDARSVGSDRRK